MSPTNSGRGKGEQRKACYFVLDGSMAQRWERPLEKNLQPIFPGSCGRLKEETLIKAALNCNQEFIGNIPVTVPNDPGCCAGFDLHIQKHIWLKRLSIKFCTVTGCVRPNTQTQEPERSPETPIFSIASQINHCFLITLEQLFSTFLCLCFLFVLWTGLHCFLWTNHSKATSID